MSEWRKRTVVASTPNTSSVVLFECPDCGAMVMSQERHEPACRSAARLMRGFEGWTRVLPAEPAVASKSVKVVAITRSTVLLEVDGVQRQLFAGDTLEVGGLEVRHV